MKIRITVLEDKLEKINFVSRCQIHNKLKQEAKQYFTERQHLLTN